jgi:ATP-dependent Clp protease ATP-binding subunit ClpA
MTAKILAQSISPIEKRNLVQINMSEFMERHSISKLLGAPAGYVGYEEASGFTDKIRRNPYSVVLFDEIEKADPSILNILLQILEEGRITDAKGRNIDFKNCIIILTSNIGTNELNQVSELGFGETSNSQKAEREKNEAVKEIKNQLEEMLPMELINRLDHIVVFDFLNKKDLAKITKKELQKLSERIKEKNIQLTITPQLVKFIAEKSYNPKEGARLVRRKIEELIEPTIAKHLLKKNKKNIHLSVTKNKILLSEK